MICAPVFNMERCISADRKKGKWAPKEKANASTGCFHLVCECHCMALQSGMTQIPIREAATQLLDLARRVEAGESITVTEDGKPLMQLVPVKKKGGIDWQGGAAYKENLGITRFFGEIPADFDDPLPEDFLITPLPPLSNEQV